MKLGGKFMQGTVKCDKNVSFVLLHWTHVW